MKKIKNQKYLFQRKKINFTQKIFEEGLNAAGYILIGLKDFGSEFLQYFAESLPKKDPRFTLMRTLLTPDFKEGFKKNTIKVNMGRLKREGLIEESEKKKIYYLTEKGEELVAYLKDRYSILEKPWDGKVRLVVFDIPENRKFQRNWLRLELLLMQYKPLQKSVYVGKHPIPDDLYQELIKNGLFENVYIFTLEKFDKQDKLLNLFRGHSD